MKTEKKTIPVQEEVFPDEVKEMALCPPAPETETEDPEAPYMASDMYQRIVALINNFESELPDTMQAAAAWSRPATLPSAFRISATGTRI